MKNTFTIYKQGSVTIAGQKLPSLWRWRCTSSNGRILASGESYKNKADCMKAVRSITGREFIFRIVE